MKANELRIGNWLHSNLTDKDFQITAEDICNIVNYPSNVTGIPLTTEWLLKFWFEYNSPENCWQINSGMCIYKAYYNKERAIHAFGVAHYGLDGVNNFAWDIKLVHQIQNLYFALTGTEPEIK